MCYISVVPENLQHNIRSIFPVVVLIFLTWDCVCFLSTLLVLSVIWLGVISVSDTSNDCTLLSGFQFGGHG